MITARVTMEMNFQVAVDAISIFNITDILFGKRWNGVSSILPMQYITPDRCTDPCMSRRVPNTLVGSQPHLIHLKYLTWFNGASPTEPSLIESMMLKRSPGPKV